MQRILETAKGRWYGILPQLGISSKLLRNRHGPCPMCGGKDRFRFDDRGGLGTWICNRCGSGDGAELVKRIKGVEFKEAAKMVEGVVGSVHQIRPEKLNYKRDRDELNRMWQEANRITPFDEAGKHLTLRCGIRDYPSSLRSHGRVMLAKVSDISGNPVTIHRTFMNPDGTVERRLMPGKLPDYYLAVRLGGTGPVLGIAEGIETALSASVLFNVPVWAAISAPLLKKWRPPEGIEKVIIFGDNDENFTGQEAAYSLARSLSGDMEVEVKIPSIPGWDWNDVQRNSNRNL